MADIDIIGEPSYDETPDPGDYGQDEKNTFQKYIGTSECFGQISGISALNSATNSRSDQEFINKYIILCTYCGKWKNIESRISDHEITRVSSSEACNSEMRGREKNLETIYTLFE